MRDKHFRGSTRVLRRSLYTIAALLTFATGVFSPAAIGASSIEVPVTVTPIKTFLAGSTQRRFGKLEFLSGLVMSSPESLFGAISSIRFKPDGHDFVAALDTGHWLTGTIQRNSGVLSGLSGVHLNAMVDREGNTAKRKADMDAEGLALGNGKVFVSYEQLHRIEIFSDSNFEDARPEGQLPHLIPNRELRRNGGMETLATSPQNSPLAGALVVVAENSVDEKGNLFAAVLAGPRKGVFAVKRQEPFAVTDGAFLPNGDLLLLERRFNFAQGIGMRIRRILADTIKPGVVVDGEILIEAGLSNQIDNMEGIDVIPQPDGSNHLILVSDDNHSFLQRNLMLEFKLLE